MANLYDKASLVQIPSGYKDGKLYNIKPFDQPFEFSRGSLATRVNEDGLIENSSTNGVELITNGTFDTDSDWGKNSGITISDGKANFSGLSGRYLSQDINFSSGKTYKIDFTVLSGSGALTIFLGAANNIYSKDSYNIGQNTIYATAGGSDSLVYFGNLFSGSIDNISIQEVNIDTPRIDYTNGKALLLEPQRTNNILKSEDITNADLVSCNFEAGYLAPDGSNNAVRFYCDPSDKNVAYLTIGANNSTLPTDSRSIYAKTVSGTGTTNLCSYYQNTNNNFTLTEEWQRFELSGTTTTSGQYNFYGVDFRRGSTTLTEVILWAPQAEEGSYATSYIPTNGQAETRLADACFLQNADVYPNSEGTIFFEIGNYNTNTSANGFNKLFHLDEVGTSNLDNVIYLEEYQGENSILLRKDGNLLLQSTPNYQDLRGSKIIIKWDSEGAKIFINGAINGVYVGDASLDIQYFGFHNPYNGNVVSTIKMKQFVCFPTTLSDDECINLTTI